MFFILYIKCEDMEGLKMNSPAVNSVDNSRFKYTKRGVKDGVIASTIAGAGFYGLSKAQMELISKSNYQTKRNFISAMYVYFQESLKQNMKKSTVSKEMKKTQKTLKTIPVIALATTTAALAGGLIGAGIDALNIITHKNKKV